jgi:polyvinyl alcohol dehydrogenase (cytochrome)
VPIRIKNHDVSLPKASLISAVLLIVALSAHSRSPELRSDQWKIAGQNLNNTCSQPAEHSISLANVAGLSRKWVFTTGGDVSATPTVDGNAVYFPGCGNLLAVEKESGRSVSVANGVMYAGFYSGQMYAF